MTTKKFEDGEMKHWCVITKKFYKAGSGKLHNIFESHLALNREKIEWRCDAA